MPTTLWQKGQSGNPAGKPLGTKDKPFLKPEYWHNLIMEQWEELSAKDRATIAMKGFACLIARTMGPQTPEESVEASEAAFKVLKMMEDASRSVGGRGHTISVEDGPPGVQTEGPAAPGI